LKLLMKSTSNFVCNVIGGDGDFTYEYLNKYVSSNNLQDHVNIVGKKTGIEKHKYLIFSDIMVLPSYEDCLPTVLIEALKYSLPIISSNEGGITDIVHHNINGFISKRNPMEINKYLKLLIKDRKLLNRMSKESRKIYKKKFTISLFEKSLINILNKD